MDIILASGSPRRRELLKSAQLDFEVISVDINEDPLAHESPQDYIQRMITSKATAAIEQLNLAYQNDTTKQDHTAKQDHIIQLPPLAKPFIILTADTIGVLPDGKTVLIKPTDRAHAHWMWQQMSDNTHQVWTAVQATQVILENESLIATWQQQIIECTEVTFVPLSSEIMSDYWDSGEPADKAGGYAIQGLAAAWVTRINGSYTNVVGLPLAQTLALIAKASNKHRRLN